jgi:hypothetical protein
MLTGDGCPAGSLSRIHLRGFFSSITAHVAATVIPPSATSSGVPIGVILAIRVLIEPAVALAM